MGIRGLHSIWRATSGLLIIALFALAPFIHGWANLLAEHEHEHSMSHCSPEAELDACHRLMFHHDHVSGCEHEQHLEESIQHCSLCAVVASLAIAIGHTPSHTGVILKEERRIALIANAELQSEFSYSKCTRGPPASAGTLKAII